MSNIYQAYQDYLNSIGGYVPPESTVSTLANPANIIQRADIPGVLFPSSDGGGITGVGGTGGIGDLFNKYNELGYMGRGLVNMGVSMFAPQLAPALGLYNMGKGIYDIGRNVLGYGQEDLSGYNQLNDPYGFNDNGTFGGNTVGTAFGNVRGLDEDESPNSTAGDYGGGVDATDAAAAEASQGGYDSRDSGDYE